ncbi:odorant receptor 49b-like [Cataglyphis hispanica]|uniref:odorant receptor 49b-like n=1 Tax=Cataglyphis hispanica TaxID=1086592 RepID=UPI00218010E1|nr:odorant receptor 49b-like [Cataglyphis hispanica]
MAWSVTLEKIIAFLRMQLAFACCWPLTPTATKKQIIYDKLFRLFNGLHAMLMICAVAYRIVSQYENTLVIIQLGCVLGTLCEVPVQIFLFTQQHDRLQNIILKMENYSKHANIAERDVIQEYIDKHITIYITTLLLMTVTLVALILVPLVLARPVLELEYPFSIDYQPMKGIIYLHQSFALYQVYVQVCATVFLALLLWFSTARFEILGNKFRMATEYSDWQECIREHQELLKFTKQVTFSISYVTLSSLGVSTITVVFSGLTFLGKFPMFVKMQYSIVCCSSLAKVFLCTWPADHLMSMSSYVGEAAYNSLWYECGVDTQKIMLYTLLRTQRPVIVSVPGLVAALSLQHYASYVSMAFSYLTSFRAILSNDED